MYLNLRIASFLENYGGDGLKRIGKYLDDILILGGITAIVTATFLLHTIAGIYVLGAALLGLGIWFARHPIGK